MSDTITKETVDIEEPEVISAPKAPSRDDLKEKGWTAKEIESADKRGMIEKTEETPTKTATEEPKTEPADKSKVDAVTTTPERRAEDKLKSSIPDFTFKTPEQEKAFLDAFGSGTPQRAMYFRMKNERQARQAAEQERDKERQSRESLEARIKVLEAGKVVPEVDELGDVIDPEDKPLTLKQLKEIEKTREEERAKKDAELNGRARNVQEAQQLQEEYARAIHPDFDKTVELTKQVLANLETLVPDRWKQAKIAKLANDLRLAATNADKHDIEDYHAALIAYEIGQFHPDYGKDVDPPNGNASDQTGNPKDPKTANGSQRHTPDQMKRIEENTQRRASSASVPGGESKRTISVDDVDQATLNNMNYGERQKFKEKYPDRYAKLLRG